MSNRINFDYQSIASTTYTLYTCIVTYCYVLLRIVTRIVMYCYVLLCIVTRIATRIITRIVTYIRIHFIHLCNTCRYWRIEEDQRTASRIYRILADKDDYCYNDGNCWFCKTRKRINTFTGFTIFLS